MATPVVEIPEATVVPAKTQTDPKQNTSAARVAEKRADVAKAKKKQKRDAHRVTLRRSHTNG
jgi:hypothetical protein